MSLTVSLIAVLIPLLFMGDVVGRLFREFAVTLAVTILVSAVVSLTLTPMMCARLLKHKPRVGAEPLLSHGRSSSSSPSSPSTAARCKLVLRHRFITLLVTIATLVLTTGPLRHRPQGLLPGAGHRRHPRHHRGAADHLASPA